MNIIDAIKSGRPFKRSGWDDSMWCQVEENNEGCEAIFFVTTVGTLSREFLSYKDDLCADDWEVQEDGITLTKSQVRKALRDATGTVNIAKERKLFDLLGFK